MEENEELNIFQRMNPFLAQLTSQFEKYGFNTKDFKKLIDRVHSFLKSRRYKGDKSKYIYQYTNISVLESIRKNRKLRLNPAIYLNDPEEGEILFSYIKHFDNGESGTRFMEFIAKIQGCRSDHIAFIRSLSENEDAMVMWNSSYGGNGSGLAVGIRAEKINKGTGFFDKGINNKLPMSLMYNSSIFQGQEQQIQQEKREFDVLPIERTGLYEILYVDKLAQNEQDYLLSDIAKCLKSIYDEIPSDLEENLIPLLSDLLKPISYLVKDIVWNYEKEYRLFYLGSIGEKCIKSSCECGVYIETAPFLFDVDGDKIYLGPKVDNIVFLKCKHSFKQSSLNVHIQQSNNQLR